MTDRTVEMVAAIYAALDGNSTLQGLLGGTGRVYNGVSSNVSAPYVTIGDVSSNDYPASTVDAQEHTIQIDVFTDQPTSGQSALKLCTQIVACIRDALHAQPLSMSAGSMANLRCQFTNPALRDPDGISWHGVLRFRAVSER